MPYGLPNPVVLNQPLPQVVTSGKRGGWQAQQGPAKATNRSKKTSDWTDGAPAPPCPALRLTMDLLLSAVPVDGSLSLLLDSWKSIYSNVAFYYYYYYC